MSGVQIRPEPPAVLAPAARLRTPSGQRLPSWTPTLVVGLVYAAYAIFLTWPLATDPGGLLSGNQPFADLGGSVAQIAYVVEHHIFPFAPAVFHGLDAPQGLQQAWVENIASFPGTALLVGLGYAFGPVGGSAAFLWLSFVLSGLSMFWFTRRLFGSVPAAALAGFAFAYCPWAVDKLNGHYQYMDGWVLVLLAWRMLEMIQRPTTRNALWAGAASAFAMWFTFYFVLIGGVAFATLAVLCVAVNAARGRRREGLRAAVISGLPIVGLFGALGMLAVLAGGAQSGQVRTQSMQQLYTYGARPLEWLLPDRHNLIFGGLTRGYLSAHLDGSNFGEASLYLGVSVLILALGGLGVAATRIRRLGRPSLSDRGLVAALAAAALAVMAMLFSAPPTVHILGIQVAMPAALVYAVTSTWRVYSRFVELLELGLCVLMALGVANLLARTGARRRWAVFALLATAVVLDLWARPPQRTSSAAPPAAYVWLRQHPGGIVADYPIEAAAQPDYHALLWQTYDRHPLLQGYDSGSETESEKLDLADLRSPDTAAKLAALGVRYIVVHPGQPGVDGLATRGYALRFDSPAGEVWQVEAAPAPAWADPLDDFALPAGPAGARYRWMQGTGVLGAFARDCPATCRGTLTFVSASNRVARKLTVRLAADQGPVLARLDIPAGRSARVRVRGVTLVDGRARLWLSTDIPPQLDAAGYGPYSVSVSRPELSLAQARAGARRS